MLLTAEILHHLLGMKPYENWDILQINWRKISSINSTSQLVYQIPEPARVSHEKSMSGTNRKHPVSLGLDNRTSTFFQFSQLNPFIPSSKQR